MSISPDPIPAERRSHTPLRLYVHIPFCIHKCHYCDFNSHERAAPDWRRYRAALLAELRHWCDQPQFAGREVASIFFGGGTPSLAPPELVAAVIAAVADCASVSATSEITLEANPGTVDAARFEGYRRAGVNRLSIGAQSFRDSELRWLERIHPASAIGVSVAAARTAGFENINLDLMYGLPHQSLAQWLRSLERAIDLAPEHLSCYQLTVEPHTRLALRHARDPYALPDDELALSMLFATREQLATAGYAVYEISNFARSGRHCRHNDGYWRYDDYIGIGAGAAGKWDIRDGGQAGGVARYANLRSPEGYIRSIEERGFAVVGDETLSRRQAAGEACWLGLRRSDGVAAAPFRARFGYDLEQFAAPALAPWIAKQMVTLNGRGLHLTRRGVAMADAISALLLHI